MTWVGKMATAFDDLEDLYSDHYTRLVRHAHSKLHDHAAAEDFVHESFLRAAERVDLTAVDNPRAYLTKVLDNAIANGFRGKSRIIVGLDESMPDPKSDVGAAFDLEERRRLVSESMTSLAPRQSRILGFFAEGKTLAQIAELEQTTRHKISCVVTRAKENLGKELIRRGFVPGAVPTASFPRVRMGFAQFKLRLADLIDRFDRGNVIQAALAATIAAGGVGAPITQGVDQPVLSTVPAITAPLDIDPTLLAGNVADMSQSVLGQAERSVSPKAMKLVGGIGRHHGDPPPDDDPLPPIDGVSPPPPEDVIEETTDLVVAIYDVTMECLETDLCL